jgi:hypothetical protein
MDEAVRIIKDGNVGIGTTAPNSLLNVQAAAGSAGTATLSTAELTVVDGNKLGQIDFQAPLESDGTDAVLVGASIWAEADDTFAADNNATELVFATGASEAAAEKVRITSDGNLGIGTTSPNYQLELSTDSAGKPTSNAWTIVSDKRLKEDVKPFIDGLDTILGINPVSYRLNGKAGRPKGAEGIGVIAQDVIDVAPYTISTFEAKLNPGDSEETELYSFDSSALTFVLINAVKELNAENKALKERISAIEAKIASADTR